MLFSIFPKTLISTFVRPDKGPISLFFIVWIFSFITPSIWPGDFSTWSMHLIFLPGTFIVPAVGPFVNTVAMYLIILKFTRINRTINELQNAFALLYTFMIISFIRISVGPYFSTLSLLFIVFPVSAVSCASSMSVNTKSMWFTVQPVAFVDISSLMYNAPLSVRLIVLPLPLI